VRAECCLIEDCEYIMNACLAFQQLKDALISFVIIVILKTY
jgi:hypothetical protein